jgi:hypothetical protein
VVVAEQVKGARLNGFVLHPDENKWWEKAVVIRDSDVQLEQLEIRGSTVSAIEFAGASGGTLVASLVHQNRNFGVLVEGQSRPALTHNRFAENGRSVEWTSSSEANIRRNVFDRKDMGPLSGDNLFLEKVWARPAMRNGSGGLQ